MPYTIRYNARTAHLDGIPERTTGPATDNSATTGVVSYYAQSACAALTRSGTRMSVYGDPIDSIALAIDTFHDVAKWKGVKLCSNCERAATKAITDTYDDAQWHAIEAAKRLDIATNTRNEQLIADAEDYAERMNDRYADAAEAADRCRIFKCEAPRHESSAWCEAHTVTDTADDYAARINDAYAKAEAANTHLSPTGQRLAAASAAHDEAMRIAHEGEGTSAQADADAAYEGARAAYRAASANHRAAREAADSEREAIAALDALNAIAAEAAERHATPVDPAVAAAGHASTQGKPYTPDPSSWNGCEARIMHNGVGSPCARPRGHEGNGSRAHRTTTGIEWMPGEVRPLHCPYARTSTGCDDCKAHAALVDRLMAEGRADTYAIAEALAVAIESDPEAVYDAARLRYRLAADQHEENGGERAREAAAAAWDAFVAAARGAGKCIDFTCYAAAEFGSDHCQRHHKSVHAHLDHTEPGKAIALITGGHGRDADPQAWLAHEGGSWLLVDDYDGDTYNVKGPDAERSVHAWAALLGLRLDGLTVAVEYAGGPVSPPVRAVESPSPVPLEWVWVSTSGGVNVFEANGHAHLYRVTEHASGYTPLTATLRGSEVVTHRRSYDSAPDARKAAQDYEARYGSGYVPLA
jgi:hypothetical protein